MTTTAPADPFLPTGDDMSRKKCCNFARIVAVIWLLATFRK